MRGFQPQHYADGGLVQRAMSLIGGRKKQLDDAVAAAEGRDPGRGAAGGQPQKPAPQPEPQPVVTSTPDGKFDEKRASKDNPAGIGFADGGRVRPRGFVAGPGTGTSDSIPAQLSNGEYVLPADTVRAVGVDKLDALREATHEPVRGFAPKAAPEEPRQFFVNGGLVDEEKQRVLPPSPTNIFTGNRLPGDSGSTSAVPAAPDAPAPSVPSKPAGLPADTLPQEQGDPFLSTPKARAGLTQGQQPTAAPSATTAPAPADSGGFSYADNNKAVGQDIKDSWNKGNYGEAVGKTVAGSVGMFTTPMIDLASRGGTAAWDGAKGFASGLFGMESSSGSATPAKPAGTASPVPAPSQTGPSGTNTPAASQPASKPARAPDATTETAAEKPPQVMPGVYQHGRGQYSDNAQGMGFAPGFTGKPSEQNMAAADALDARSQADSMARLQARGFSPGGSAQAQATYDPNAGTSSQWMTDLRDPRNLALRNASVGSTIFRTKEEAMAANKAKMANVAGVRGAIAGQMHDAQQADTTRYQSDNTLAGTQEQANAQRYSTDAQAAESRRRGAIEAGKLGLEKEVRGFDIRAGQRNEALYQKYDAAKTPEEKSAIAQQIRDLSGKNTESPWKIQVTPTTKNADGSTTDGSIYRYNTQTGAVERVDGGVGNPSGPPAPKSKAEYDALPKGAQYIKDGKVLVKS